MGLRQGLRVVVQGPDLSTNIRCDGFHDVPSSAAYIAIVPDGTPAGLHPARELTYEVKQRLGAMPGVWRDPGMPCWGMGPGLREYSCHAFSQPDCRFVFALVGDPVAAFQNLPERPTSAEYLPILPPGTKPGTLPRPLAKRNARNWTVTPIEFVPEIFATAGITTTEQRIFISYRRREATALCNQLFDALNRAGFDVFVDRFRISVGADFQQRILEELAQKSMVLFLETRGILKSDWTRYEAAVAKSARLGILALHVPGGTAIPDIDASRRIDVAPGWNRVTRRLSKTMLDEVVARVRRDHAFHDVRRRQLLRDSMRRALQRQGVTAQTLLPSGAIEVTAKGATYVLWLPSRPAELSDFHHVATGGGAGTPIRAIFGPASHMVGRARERMRWLAKETRIASFDESQIERKAAAIAAGRSL